MVKGLTLLTTSSVVHFAAWPLLLSIFFIFFISIAAQCLPQGTNIKTLLLLACFSFFLFLVYRCYILQQPHSYSLTHTSSTIISIIHHPPLFYLSVLLHAKTSPQTQLPFTPQDIPYQLNVVFVLYLCGHVGAMA